VESHVHCFGAVWLDIFDDDAEGCAVISLDGRGRLFVSHLFEEMSYGNRLSGIYVQCTQLGLGCTRHDGLEYFGDVEHGPIVGWIIHIILAEKVAPRSASCCGFTEEVQSIVMDSQHHVTFFLCWNSIRVGCHVIQEPIDEEECLCIGFGLGCCE
jgi:hypothetical protein